MSSIRPSILSGSWYPADREELRETIQQFISGADTSDVPTGRPHVAVVPHAGYAYSGPTAGKLYGLLKGLEYDTIFILAPNHRAAISRIALSSCTEFTTPLGTVAVNQQVSEELARSTAFTVDDSAHAREHAVEIHLPFLQVVFGDQVKIVPILVPRLDDSARTEAAQALARWRTTDNLLIISTDFTHYGADYGYEPFTKNIPEELIKLDQGAIKALLACDAEQLLAYGRKTGITMCGLQAAAMAISGDLPDGVTTHLIDYCRSGDRDQDYSFSVSYAALLLNIPEPDPGQDREHQPETLTDQEKQLLLNVARDAVTAAAGDQAPATVAELAAELGMDIGPELLAERGAFVTLTKHGSLRGCIGYIEGIKPLIEAVQDNGRSAAVGDPRFPAVTPDELPEIHVEISALTPLRRVEGHEAIVIGQHGIVLQQGFAKSVFLPQVAPEQGWDLETTLTQLALKAGLAPDAWRRNTDFSVFEAEIIEE